VSLFNTGPFKHRFSTFRYQEFSERDLDIVPVHGIDGIVDEDRNITAMR